MSISLIKIIACVSMLVDHIALLLVDKGATAYIFMRTVGRLAFPLFAFALVEGFFHTSDLKKYFFRLGIFAVVAEASYDFAVYGFNRQSVEGLEIGVTLLMGLAAVAMYHHVMTKYITQPFVSNMFAGLVIILFCVAAESLKVAYGMYGILLIMCMYLFRGKKIVLSVALLLLPVLFSTEWQVFSVFSMIFIIMYNGEKGKNIKYLFYTFYTCHLVLLGLMTR